MMVRNSLVRIRLISPLVLAVLGCAGFPLPDRTVAQPPHEVRSPAPPATKGMVFAADGAGGFLATSAALAQAFADVGEPLAVETVRWSHGWGRVLSDEMGHQHSREAGHRLAARVAAFRAGGAVVLSAAESLPPDSIERLILLAPAVSADYDLRPALRSVHQGIDVFCSRRDWWYLGIGVTLVGTADGHWRPAAGRNGFTPIVTSPQDALLYEKLHQHCWERSIEWTGNHGGHYGAYQPNYLKAYILPLLDDRPFSQQSIVASPAAAGTAVSTSAH
jgi:hypothetical protein